jgi:hypothetical protein
MHVEKGLSVFAGAHDTKDNITYRGQSENLLIKKLLVQEFAALCDGLRLFLPKFFLCVGRRFCMFNI